MTGCGSRAALAAAIAPLAHSVWRADQMGSWQAAAASTGYPQLDGELPNRGWPRSALIELLLQQTGIGEMRLLRPSLQGLDPRRRVALVQPPHRPQALAWWGWGLAPERLLWIETPRTADALWSAEQILQNGSCGALLFWPGQIRGEALRRLHLAAQGSDLLFWMFRPLAAAQDASPSPLRMGLRPLPAGLRIDILKRRGPQQLEPVQVEWPMSGWVRRTRFQKPTFSTTSFRKELLPQGSYEGVVA